MYYFIVNATSRTGKAQKIWRDVKAELDRREVEYKYYITSAVGHAQKLAKQICSIKGDINLIVVGGDGTANEVINGMHNMDKVRFGYIPTGSGNDLGRGLGINKRKPVDQLVHILESNEILKMDLGEVTTEEGVTRKFAISAGIGVDASVCKQALTSKLKKFLNKFGLGSATYVILTVKTMFTMPLYDGTVELDDGTVKHPHNIIFCAAMNHPWEGGGVPMAPNASATDGMLSFCCVSDIKRAKCFVSLGSLMAARHDRIAGFDIYNCKSAKINLKDKMVVHADGEYCGEVKSVEFRCISEAVSVII
ncbi:MAG: diacylglycerol kinase family lipid kinase [Lachnospiraceae bacterium]|nr:diacylglycerol kinase family lipid kinase [Lachnospiraceae bacterium]